MSLFDLELRREQITVDSENGGEALEWGHLVHIPLGRVVVADIDQALPRETVETADAVLRTDRGYHLVYLDRPVPPEVCRWSDLRYAGMARGVRNGHQMRVFSKSPPHQRRILIGLTDAGHQFAAEWNGLAARAGDFDPDRSAKAPSGCLGRAPTAAELDDLLGRL